jgi:uncharacterized protein YecT (DUF1311 family)
MKTRNQIALTFLALCWATGAQAQSFDCDEAKTASERMICADKGLMDLDEQLGTAYSDALGLVADPPGLIRTQHAWLAQRDKCRAAACMALAYRGRIAAIARLPRAAWATYSNPRLGLAFEYLANRRIAPCEGVPRCVTVSGRLFDAKLEELVRFQAATGSLEHAAIESNSFERIDGKWMTTATRFGPVEAESFRGKGWTGLKVGITCGVDDEETGYHAAGGECLDAVLSDGSHAIIVNIAPYGTGDDATQRSFASLRFVP